MKRTADMKNALSLSSNAFTLLVRWAIVLALWVLLISMATGQAGISNYLELVKNRDELQDVNMQIALENQLLEEKIQRLRTSPDAQLRYLKEQFGYVERGEYVYHFNRTPVQEIKAKKKKPASGSATAETQKKQKI